MAVSHPRLDDEPRRAEPSVGALARGVWHRALVVLIVLLITLVVALAVANQAPRTYEAKAEVRVSSGNIRPAEGISSSEANTLLGTQVQYLLSSELAADVAQRLPGEIEIIDVAVEGVPESQVASVTVVADTALGAAEASNTYVIAYDERRDRAVVEEATERAEQATEQATRLEERLAELQGQIDTETQRVNGEIARIAIARNAAARVGTVLEPADVIQPNTSFLTALQTQYSGTASQLADSTARLEEYQQIAEAGDGGVAIVSTAMPPSTASSPGAAQVLALASILGLALGVGLALLLTALDRRLAVARDVSAAAGGLETVGPTVARADAGALDLDGMRLPPLAGGTVDSFLAPAAWLGLAVDRTGQHAVLVTSPRNDRSAAPALAVALARCGRSVVLVDAALRTHAPVELDPTRRRGVSDVLLGDAQVHDVLADVEVQGSGSLRIISSGRGGADLALLAGAGMRHLIEVLRCDADVVVVAGSPALHGRELELVPAGVNVSLVVVTLRATRRDDLSVVVEHLDRAGAPALGVLVADPSLRGRAHGGPSTVRRRAGRGASTVPSVPSMPSVPTVRSGSTAS